MSTEKNFDNYQEGDKVLVLSFNARLEKDTWKKGTIIKVSTISFSPANSPTPKYQPYYLVNTTAVYWREKNSSCKKGGVDNFYAARTVTGIWEETHIKNRE